MADHSITNYDYDKVRIYLHNQEVTLEDILDYAKKGILQSFIFFLRWMECKKKITRKQPQTQSLRGVLSYSNDDSICLTCKTKKNLTKSEKKILQPQPIKNKIVIIEDLFDDETADFDYDQDIFHTQSVSKLTTDEEPVRAR